ncbi:unnamed protein product [Gordionus sp. m RMFG-2023]
MEESNASELKFPPIFEKAETLMISEVFQLLEQRKKQDELSQDEGDFTDIFNKTYNYTRAFSRFKNRDTTISIRNMLMGLNLHKFELAALANLCPETSEEAKSHIPTLIERFEDDELQPILDDMRSKISIQY